MLNYSIFREPQNIPLKIPNFAVFIKYPDKILSRLIQNGLKRPENGLKNDAFRNIILPYIYNCPVPLIFISLCYFLPEECNGRTGYENISDYKKRITANYEAFIYKTGSSKDCEICNYRFPNNRHPPRYDPTCSFLLLLPVTIPFVLHSR